MKWSMVRRDLIRNKAINLALLLFMMFATSLAVLSVLTGVQTYTSIAELYETAQPPHFLQMHKGELNQGEINSFMSSYEGLTHWQTQTMINIYGENLTIVGAEDNRGRSNEYDLSDLRLDIGLVKQNDTKDLLLNSLHEKVSLQEGEIGIPVILRGMYNLEIGDRVILEDNDFKEEFVIDEFILDAQMNSTMASSTRILLNDRDYERISGEIGEYEYLIEAYFTATDAASAFQTAYENAGLPQNGQAVTYAMIFLLSALTDIVTVFVLLLVSLLLIVVSFICIRFAIMAALEEDLTEIGTMKAIGLPFKDIRDIYLYKYRVLAAAAVIGGIILALLLRGVVTKHISDAFGSSGISPLALLMAIAAAGIVFLLIDVFCKRVLKRIKNVTVVDALVSKRGLGKDQGSVKDGMHRSRKLPVNWLIGLREVFYQFKNWLVVFAVVAIAVLLIMVPVNLLNTFEDREFITYMGSSLEDILIEVEAGENLERNYANVKQALETETSIQNYFEYRTVRVQAANPGNVPLNLNIEVGDNAGNGLQYLSGMAPEGENQIALSYINADELQQEVGDTIVLLLDSQEQEFIISGIYQDVTSGGKTAMSKYSFPGVPANKYSFSVDLQDKGEVAAKAEEWGKLLGAGVTVDPMEEFVNQTLGGVSRQLRTVVLAVVVIGVSLAILITVLFLRLRLTRDLAAIAILKAVGFSEKDINQQYLIKIGSVSILGILAGIVLTNLLGERIVNAGLSIAGLGVKQVNLITNPVMEYILCPLLLLVSILVATWIVLRTIRGYNVVSIIKE